MFNQASDRFIARAITAVCFLAVVVMVWLLGAKYASLPDIFAVHFNIFGMLSASAAVVTLILLVRLVTMRDQSEECKWFIFAVMGDLLFTAGEAMERFNTTPAGGLFWSAFSGMGVSLVPVGVLLFALSYTKTTRSRLDVVTPLVAMTGGFVIFFYAEGSLIYSQAPKDLFLTPWGYSNNAGAAFPIILIWLLTLYSIAVVVLIRFWRRNTNALLRKQARLYSLALIGPLVAGFFTDGLTSLVDNNPFPPMAGVLNVLMALIIFYGLKHYQFFRVNPAVLAQNILGTMNEAVVVVRHSFAVEYMNKQAATLLGEMTLGSTPPNIHALFAAGSWEKIHQTITRHSDDVAEIDDVFALSPTGKEIPVRVFVSRLVEAGRFQAYVFVISDVSALVESYNHLATDAARIKKLLGQSRQLEHQLQQEKAGVEHTVELRTRELRRTQERLKAADAMKTEFIMLGSHNLRTPITIMAGSIEMLKTSTRAHERAAYVESLEQSVNRLKDFVEDMVTISSLETGSGLVMQPATASQLLAPLVAEAHALAVSQNLAFTYDGHPDGYLNANLPRLQSALRNVIDNAFKFTKKGSVGLKVEATSRSLVITITDSGIGIKSANVAQLFTKFHRATGALEYNYEGEGIGLYLSRLIIDEHKGSITVHSTEGRGSTFTITLPFHEGAIPPDLQTRPAVHMFR